jgi:hypothetical protein
VRSAPAVKAICVFDYFDDVVHCLPTLSSQTRMTRVWLTLPRKFPWVRCAEYL